MGEKERIWVFVLDGGESWTYYGLFKDACAKFAETHQVKDLIGVIRKP